MQKNDLYKCNNALVRVLAIDGDQVLLIDCVKPTMPRWASTDSLKGWERCAEGEYQIPDAWRLKPQEEIMTEQRKLMHERFTLIVPVLPVIHKESIRSVIIAQVAEMNGVSKQTVRKYLCLFLASQKIESLAPGSLCTEKPLTRMRKTLSMPYAVIFIHNGGTHPFSSRGEISYRVPAQCRINNEILRKVRT